MAATSSYLAARSVAVPSWTVSPEFNARSTVPSAATVTDGDLGGEGRRQRAGHREARVGRGRQRLAPPGPGPGHPGRWSPPAATRPAGRARPDRQGAPGGVQHRPGRAPGRPSGHAGTRSVTAMRDAVGPVPRHPAVAMRAAPPPGRPRPPGRRRSAAGGVEAGRRHDGRRRGVRVRPGDRHHLGAEQRGVEDGQAAHRQATTTSPRPGPTGAGGGPAPRRTATRRWRIRGSMDGRPLSRWTVGAHGAAPPPAASKPTSRTSVPEARPRWRAAHHRPHVVDDGQRRRRPSRPRRPG